MIGIGGTGYKVLRDFRKRLWGEQPDIRKRHSLPVRFLYIDSDELNKPENIAGNPDLRVNGQDTAITPDEYLNIKNVNLNSVFDNLGGYPRLRYVVGNGAFIRSCMGEVGAAAGQKRRAGRILFANNAHTYINKIHNIVQELSETVGNAKDLNIYIFAMIPEQLPPAGADAGRYHANGYAALMELSALNAGVFQPCDVVKGLPHITLTRPGDNKQFGLTVYTNVNRNGAMVDSYKPLPQREPSRFPCGVPYGHTPGKAA